MSVLSRLLVLAVLALTAAPARADEPTAVIDRFYATLLQVMKEGPRLGFEGRAQTLAPAVQAAYDMPGMTRASIGAGAAQLPPEEFQRLVEAFTRYTVANYAHNFASYDGERFETGSPTPAHGGGVLVPTRILPAKGDPARLTYLMRQTGGSWRIADVLLDGTISQLAVRRSEFQAVMKRSGAAGLLKALEQRTAALASG